MNETLIELQRIHQATNWVLLAIASMDFIAVLIAARIFYLTKDIHRRTDQLLEESKQVSFYLFGKLGPLDMK